MARKGHRAWNKGLTKDTSESVKKYADKMKGKKKDYSVWNKGLTKNDDERIKGGRSKGIKMTREQKKLRSFKYQGEGNPNWRGGNDSYLHKRAYEMFGKDFCDVCKISKEEYKNKTGERFHMHNCLDPKDYTILEEYVWMCVCEKCHPTVEAIK